MLSIIIPSRQPQYLQQTIDDLLIHAEGEVEVIVIFDGIWPDPIIKDHPKVIVLHQGTIHANKGMKEAINDGIRVSKGQYIMKIDEHCSVDQGYDLKLIRDHQPDWVQIPRRKRLDAESWTLINDGRPDIDYMAVEYPYNRPFDKTQGLHGAEWKRPERAEIMLDDTPTMQGSCYFMTRAHWDSVIKRLDSEHYGPFTMEAQEVSLATWLSGGQVKVNKNTWYAHWHKGRTGKGYGFSTEQYKNHSILNEKGRLYAINYWLYTKDYKYDWGWFVTQKFPTMPGWSADWLARVDVDRMQDYSTLGYKDDYWLSDLRKE